MASSLRSFPLDPMPQGSCYVAAAAGSDEDGAAQQHTSTMPGAVPFVRTKASSGAAAVELSARQFDRSISFDAGASSSNRGWDEEDSSDSDDDSSSMSTAGPAGASPDSWAATAGAFEPFEVEEQATEVKYLRETYAKKDRECEHLRQIIKELSQSRSRAHKTKVELEEQFAALQKEYYRVIKVSDLARTVSQQAVARTSTLKGDLAAAQDQARRSRRRAAAAEAKAAALAEENVALKQKLALLEKVRLGGEDCRTSACARAYLFSQSVSLY